MDDQSALDDFRGRFGESKVADSKRQTLVEDLIDQNDRLVKECRRLSDDFDAQNDQRRRLQNRIRDELEPLLNRRGFVLVLIDADGDGYIFRDTFLNKNEEGGRKAADEVLERVQKYMGELGLDVNNTDIVVRAYANLRGLGRHCASDGLMKATADLGLFANGFTKRQPLFDFVDVGLGKERADDKVRETFSFFVNNVQCKHVLLGVAHDSGYAAFLERFAANESIRDRITLLQGFQINPVIRGLGIKRIVQFTSVFASRPISNTQDLLKQPQSTAAKQVNRGTQRSCFNATVDLGRFGPVSKNGAGLRMDTPLAVDTGVMLAMKKKNLCVWLFLRGHCDGCSRNHAHPPLTAKEQDVLWAIGRQGVCFTHRKGMLCNDPMCVYGHATWCEPGGEPGTAARRSQSNDE